MELNVNLKEHAVLMIDWLDLLRGVAALSMAGMATYWSPFARHVAEDAGWTETPRRLSPVRW